MPMRAPSMDVAWPHYGFAHKLLAVGDPQSVKWGHRALPVRVQLTEEVRCCWCRSSCSALE
jgi:hypothetical protein